MLNETHTAQSSHPHVRKESFLIGIEKSQKIKTWKRKVRAWWEIYAIQSEHRVIIYPLSYRKSYMLILTKIKELSTLGSSCGCRRVNHMMIRKLPEASLLARPTEDLGVCQFGVCRVWYCIHVMNMNRSVHSKDSEERKRSITTT